MPWWGILLGFVLGSGGTVGALKLWADARVRRADKKNEALKDYFADGEAFQACETALQRAIQQGKSAEEILPLLDAYRLAADHQFNTCIRIAANVRSGYVSADDTLVQVLAKTTAAMPATYAVIMAVSARYGHSRRLVLDEGQATELHRLLRQKMADFDYEEIRDSWDEHAKQATKQLPPKR